MAISVLEGRLEQEDVQEDIDLDMLAKRKSSIKDELMIAPTTLPITMALDLDALHASMPLPHSSESIAPTLKLSFNPSMTGLEITWTLDPVSEMMVERVQGAVDRAQKVGMDVVKAVAEVERVLKDT
jgi:hypothetical protein